VLALESFNTVKVAKEQFKQKRQRMLAIFLFTFENYFYKEKLAIEHVTKQLIKHEIDGRCKKKNSDQETY